jgi:hypothetical protein
MAPAPDHLAEHPTVAGPVQPRKRTGPTSGGSADPSTAGDQQGGGAQTT